MKKSQFFLRFSFLTKKKQNEFGRYLISLHPQKQTAIAIYQFYVAHGAGAKQLLLPRQDLAQLIFPKQKAQLTKLNNGLSDLNIVIEEYLHWLTKVKGVRNQQQDLALVEAFSKNGDEKGVNRVVGRLERQLEGETYRDLDYYKIYSELLELKIGIPFSTYRKEVMSNYRKSAYVRSQWAIKALLTNMVEYDCNHIVNGFDFEFPLHSELNTLLSSEITKGDDFLKLQQLMRKLYESKKIDRFDEQRDNLLNLIPNRFVNKKVEILTMLKNFIIRNRKNIRSKKVNKIFFELNNIQMHLMYESRRVITPTLYMNYMVSSKKVSKIKDELLIFKMLLPVNIREVYYHLALAELAVYYNQDIGDVENVINYKVKDPMYEIFRRRIILVWMILDDANLDATLSHMSNFRQYIFRHQLSIVRNTTENLGFLKVIELLLNPNTESKQIYEVVKTLKLERYRKPIFHCWKKLKPADQNIPTNW